MVKLKEYLNKIQDNVSSAAGIGCRIDNLHGKVLKPPYPKPNDKRQIIVDQDNEKEEDKINGRTKNEFRILIDFDGVIHKYSKKWQNGEIYDDPLEYVKDALNKIRSVSNGDKIKIIIFTSRVSNSVNGDANKQREMMKDYLNKYEIPYDDITSDKLSALLYIDDNGYRFDGNWKEELPKILEIIRQRIEEKNNRGK